MNASLRAIEAWMERHVPVEHEALPGRTNHLRAGVAVPLIPVGDDVCCVVTRRPVHLRRHGGEVSFPGGRPEPDDRDLEATAWRECAEEIGVRPIRTLGRLSSMPIWTSDWRLEPWVVELDESASFVPDPEEVDSVHLLSLHEVLNAGAIEAIVVRYEGFERHMPIFRPGGHIMYGATAMTFVELLGVVAPALGGVVPPLVPGTLQWTDLPAFRHRGLTD